VLALAAFAAEPLEAQSSTVSQHGASPLAGEWQGQTFAAGSAATVTLMLYANGTYSRRIVTATEFGWTLQGDGTLIMAPLVSVADDGNHYGKAVALGVTLMGDSLIARAGKNSIVLRRVTASVPETPLLGRWEGLSDMNEPLTQDFTADGRLIITVTHSREAGRWAVSAETINWTEQIPSPGKKRSRYRVEGEKLLIYMTPKLPPLELSRIPPETEIRN
jgi:hypothetical protein